MRGDRPMKIVQEPIVFVFTPHARGSTDEDSAGANRFCVYPACAGIDLVISLSI